MNTTYIAISAGFDRHVEDWGGTLTTEDYFHHRSSCEGLCAVQMRRALLRGPGRRVNTNVLGEKALALCQGMDNP